jgi:hypothetical protein
MKESKSDPHTPFVRRSGPQEDKENEKYFNQEDQLKQENFNEQSRRATRNQQDGRDDEIATRSNRDGNEIQKRWKRNPRETETNPRETKMVGSRARNLNYESEEFGDVNGMVAEERRAAECNNQSIVHRKYDGKQSKHTPNQEGVGDVKQRISYSQKRSSSRTGLELYETK